MSVAEILLAALAVFVAAFVGLLLAAAFHGFLDDPDEDPKQ